MQGLGSGVANPGGSGRYSHITAAVRRRNALGAAALAAFVGGVYLYTYRKMANNELQTLAAELDEVRAARSDRAGGGAVAAAGAPPAGVAAAAAVAVAADASKAASGGQQAPAGGRAPTLR